MTRPIAADTSGQRESVAEFVARTRKASGVPPTVVDAVALARVAAVLKTAA